MNREVLSDETMVPQVLSWVLGVQLSGAINTTTSISFLSMGCATSLSSTSRKGNSDCGRAAWAPCINSSRAVPAARQRRDVVRKDMVTMVK
ncbi:hypothetical protein D3C81_1828140 [compost metagenome]